MFRSIDDYDFQGKNVLVRVDFNVPMQDGSVSDDKRIVEALPTIDKIIDDHGVPVLCSHLGRPKGKKEPKYSLAPIADYLKNKFGYNVIFAEDCIGEPAKEAVKKAMPGDIVLLENLRFHAEEEKNDEGFSRELASIADVYVNDAFGAAHRAHASTEGVAHLFEDKLAGRLMINELDNLKLALQNPKKPFVAIIGGAKITGKIDVIRHLLDKTDSLLIGGGMMFTFYKAMGYNVGKSLVEEEKVHLAHELLEYADKNDIALRLPTDVVISKEFKEGGETKTVSVKEIPDGWMGLDIGPKTRDIYTGIINTAKTIVWNGPMGVFEMESFAKGTYEVARALADATKKGAITIVGGGDSAAAIDKMGYEKSVTHVSTGGGASLEYLEGKKLPGVEALKS